MRITHKLTSLIAGTTLVLLSATSHAAIPKHDGFYLGGNLGYSNSGEKIAGLSKHNTRGPGGSINLGYQFNPYFALEGAALRFSDSDFGLGVKSKDHYGLALAVKGILPLDDGWSVFAKVGAASVHRKLKPGTVIPPTIGSFTRTVPYAGLGVGYWMTPDWQVNLQGVITGKSKEDVPSMHLISLGLAYMF